LPKRARYERETVYQILDEGLVCHVGFVVGGQPFVIPTGYGRAGDTFYLHGSRASRMLKALREGVEVCVTVTLLDALVLALALAEASAKVRTGPPIDDEDDYELPHWAGLLPLLTTTGDPVPDPRQRAGIDTPEYLRDYRRGRHGEEGSVSESEVG